MAVLSTHVSAALLPNKAEQTAETQNQTIAALQLQFQELSKQLAEAQASATGASSTEGTPDVKATKAK